MTQNARGTRAFFNSGDAPLLKRMTVPLILGLAGIVILISLGNWQLRRLAWKEGVLAEIETRIAAEPAALPATPAEGPHKYAPVTASGTITGPEAHVLVSVKRFGPAYRIISRFETDGRAILLDRGFVPSDAKDAPRPVAPATITGNLHWPDDRTSSTPDNDLDANIWFARDIDALAAHLGTEPTLVILATTSETDPPVTPLPIDISGIPNDHLEYAITWYSLALIWAGMTVYLLWRIRRRTV